MNKGLFAWIRKTNFSVFLVSWVIGIFVYMVLYWLLSLFNSTLTVDSSTIKFTFNGLVESLYASLLAATIFGIDQISANISCMVVVYSQVVLSTILILILIDKLLQKYVFPMYHVHHTQDKKINTMTLTMSIFRNDIDRLKAEFKSKTKYNVNIKDIESIIDGLYVTFLDIDRMFSSKNIHKHHISDRQYLIIITNIDDSLYSLSKFIDFLNNHKIDWTDKNIKFWIDYILDTAEKTTMHFDDVKQSNTKVIIAVENIKDNARLIRKKL